ncbi:MAG TPA: nucleoside hydrolase [Verrucomicrobiae bacterium]|nr:nucleoside hydrolase [Verrucomicrobiae bacterium]
MAALAGSAALLTPSGYLRAGQPTSRPQHPLPVILDTDIGDDIDDTWALGFLLKCPELDLKLAVGDYGKSQYRGRLLAKFLQAVGRADIPIGLGLDVEPHGEGPQSDWVKDYELSSYPGKVHKDGVEALIDTIMNSSQPITVIGIAPMPNLAAALVREPRIARRARFVGMAGSIRRGYDDSPTPCAEWNVKAAPKACQQVCGAGWPITITPLDTCGRVKLEGRRYAKVRDSKEKVAATIIENYRIWIRGTQAAAPGHSLPAASPAEEHSSVLFDTVAVYLAFGQALCRMESLPIEVTDDGYTRVSERGTRMLVATEWKDFEGYKDLLVERLTSSVG